MLVLICAKVNAQDSISIIVLLLGFGYMIYFIFLLQSYINNKSEQTFQIPAVTPPPALPSISKED